VKQLAREIDRIAGKKGPNYVTRMQESYRELLQKASAITQRARELCGTLPNATADDVFGANTLQAFIARTERCRDRSEIGFERYESLAIIGRNMHTLGRLLIAREAADSEAASTRRKAA